MQCICAIYAGDTSLTLQSFIKLSIPEVLRAETLACTMHPMHPYVISWFSASAKKLVHPFHRASRNESPRYSTAHLQTWVNPCFATRHRNRQVFGSLRFCPTNLPYRTSTRKPAHFVVCFSAKCIRGSFPPTRTLMHGSWNWVFFRHTQDMFTSSKYFKKALKNSDTHCQAF